MSTRLTDVEMQLAELEMLRSMYPDESDIIISDLLIHSELRKFVEENGDDPQRLLVFILKLQLQEQNGLFHIEFSPPLKYPSGEKISALIRSPNLSKTQYADINEDLKCYIGDLETGDPQILQVIEWINEHGQNYVTAKTGKTPQEKDTTNEEPKKLSRIWIYSHHIYNKLKRKNILEWSKELGLTGFSMPGKPGVVCVEGPSENCEEFWLRIKKLNWKHIEVRHRENLENIQERRYFEMEEVSFEVHGNRGNHMSMGSLFQYMTQHNCGNTFVHLFGIEGRLPEKQQELLNTLPILLCRMRRQTWKRLSLVHREDGMTETSNEASGSFVSKFRDPVSEMDFGVHGGRDYHMDVGKFAAFLAQHQSHNVFSILFGVEGKVTDEK